MWFSAYYSPVLLHNYNIFDEIIWILWACCLACDVHYRSSLSLSPWQRPRHTWHFSSVKGPFCCIPVASAASPLNKVQVWGLRGSWRSTRSRWRETRGWSEDRGSQIWGTCGAEDREDRTEGQCQLACVYQGDDDKEPSVRVALTHFVRGRSPPNPFPEARPQRKVPDNLHGETTGRVIYHAFSSCREEPQICRLPGEKRPPTNVILIRLRPEDTDEKVIHLADESRWPIIL